MRFIPFILSALATIGLVVVLNSPINTGGTSIPPLGKFLSPQVGLWQNAKTESFDAANSIQFTGLRGKSSVYFDERMVPHIFAADDRDAWFIQGYLHAKFRLWQMEFQVRAASGRLCEVLGEKIGNASLLDRADRNFRRMGMVYAAENELKEIEKDTMISEAVHAYTDGVNAYINNLEESQLPIEYKLLNYRPEMWTPLKSALLIKYMAFDLSGKENDFEFMNARSIFSPADFDQIYPTRHDSIDPIISNSAALQAARINLKLPANVDSFYLQGYDTNHVQPLEPHPNNGSNNWALNGHRTVTGKPILCSDPHLALNLPSIWFELQVHTKNFNAYGVSIPGAPFVVIGFNDSCAFGITNSMRDVRDYYEINFRDDSMKEYFFNGEWKKTKFRYERIAIRGKPDFIDTVAYTEIGPVVFDKHFDGSRTTNGKYYAMRWKAHDPSNELKCFALLDRARNYNEYTSAIHFLHTPGQNAIFAAKNGDIAMTAQGEFPAKWHRQGDFVMEGKDSSYFWQGMIPQEENPHQLNPERNFVSSANQYPVDPANYPYYLGGQFAQFRALMINRLLSETTGASLQDMMKLQTSNYNLLAEMARPVIMRSIDENNLGNSEKKYFELMKNWDLQNDPDEKGATVFLLFWNQLEHEIWDDEFGKTKLPMLWPQKGTTLEGVLKDTSFKFADNINTPEKETVSQDILAAFKKAVPKMEEAESQGNLAWSRFKGTRISHLLRLDAFSRGDLDVGGGDDIINATTSTHGPSWRMIVQMSDPTLAYVVYPGGQSGNPGSKFYDDFVSDWARGNYYIAWIMKEGESKSNRVIGTLKFEP